MDYPRAERHEKTKADFSEIIESKLKNKEIVFIKEKSKVTYDEVEEVRRSLDGDKFLYVCDFYIEGIETDPETNFDGTVFKKGKIINVDHHSEHEKMRDFVSSAVLALDEAENNPEYKNNSAVLIHHTDADSVLTTLIMTGAVSPEQVREWHFRRAALAADHFGESDPMADLLQALRNGEFKKQEISERLKFSVRNLEKFLNGEPLEAKAKELVENYQNERRAVEQKVKAGEYGSLGSNQEVAWIDLPASSEADAVWLPDLFPNSAIMFIAKPRLNDDGSQSGKFDMNVRLGRQGLEKGLDLRQVMEKAGLEFGGRWNAGANKRKGGTELNPQEFAQKIFSVLN